MSWTAVAPVPMTATLRPSSGYSSSQAVVWMTLPAKSVTPGMSGTFGWDRKPVAVIRYRADSISPSATVTRQTAASSSQRAPSTTVLNRMCLRTSNLSATSSAYCLISGPGGEQPRPVRVRLEEVGVRGGGDVDGQAGVAVDVPGSAEVVLAVEDHEVVVAHPLELDGRAYPPETGSHDDRVE